MNFCWVNECDVDLACSSLSAQCCGCPSLCSLHGALQSWNWQRTGKFLPLHCSRTTLCPSSHTAHVPTSRVWRSVWVLVWHQLKPSPPFPAGGMFRRPWGVPFQFLSSFARGRQHWAVCSLLWYFRENCISSWGSRYILAIPSYPNKDGFVEEISDLELVSKGVYERSPVPLEGTQSLDLYTRLSPVLEQDLTRLWHPSPGLPANSTPARGGLQSQVTVFVGKKVEKDSGCQIYNQIFFL